MAASRGSGIRSPTQAGLRSGSGHPGADGEGVDMKRRLSTGICVVLILLLLGGILFLELQSRETEEELSRARAALPEPVKVAPPEAVSVHPETVQLSRPGGGTELEISREGFHIGAGIPEEGGSESRTADHSDDIEEIKRGIYEREIESVGRLHLLDDLVQTGDADTRGFWGDGWSGVDDWKRSSNGFRLEKTDDGTLIFIPDEETARTYTFFENLEVYTYDEENRAFVNEIDYHGKTIVNVVKFINDDVLAMMTISGRKVDLNLYQRNAEQR
jgi:hypothetical protein